MPGQSIRAPIDDLVIFCADEVISKGEECTFERLVFECFSRFPEAFGLKRYPEWPDSARVNKAWLRCRTDKGWLAGNVKQGFVLTPAGKRAADRTRRELANGAESTPPPASNTRHIRERHEALLRSIRASAAFQSFKSDPSQFKPTQMELRVLFGATLETPRRVLRQNLRAYEEAASAYNDEQVKQFIAACANLLIRS